MITFARRTLAVWLGVLLLGVAGKAMGAETRLAGEGGSFTPTVDMVVRYCGGSTCSASRTIPAGTLYRCDNSTWGDVAPGIVKSCYGVPVAPPPPAPAPLPFVACNPDLTKYLPGDIYVRAKWHQPIPASVESDNTDWAAWPCDDGTVQVQLYTRAQFNEFTSFIGTALLQAAFGKPLWLTMVNDWIAAQPVGTVTQKEYDFVVAMETEYAAQLGLQPPPVEEPPPVTVQRYAVAPIKAGDRPVVTLPSPGSTSKTKDTPYRIAVDKDCNPSIRIPDTNYMSVTGQLSTKGEVLPANMFASCALVK